MTPIDGRRHPKGDKWGKPLPKGSISGRGRSGCPLALLSLLLGLRWEIRGGVR